MVSFSRMFLISMLASAAAYPSSDRSIAFCCEHAAIGNLQNVFEANSTTAWISDEVFTDSEVYPECQLLNLVPGTCNTASLLNTTVRNVIGESSDAQKRLETGIPLVGYFIVPGTCQDVGDSPGRFDNSTKLYSWNSIPMLSPGDFRCEGPTLDMGNFSNTTLYLDFRLECAATSNDVLNVRAQWLTEHKGPTDLCGDKKSVELDRHISSEDWTTEPGMPRWTCIDIAPSALPEGPLYRLQLTSIGELPCGTSATPTPQPPTPQPTSDILSLSGRTAPGHVAITLLSFFALPLLPAF